jgi:methylenetetrahydrofolate reductase (NADPH)
LRQLLNDSERFVTVAELVTSRGVISERNGRRVLKLARELAGHDGIDALSITDNPGGNAMLAADTLGTDLVARGQEVIMHLACKDWNRNALQSKGWKLASEGFENVLALSGDYPVSGYRSAAAPVFDIDSVGLLRMFSDMNAGLGGRDGIQRTDFFLGAVVNNHKRYEREVMPQYFKLKKKIDNGAAFIITQIGYDARKDDELLRWMRLHGLSVPVIANVFVLSARAAETFHSGRIPGVVVTDELRELVQARSSGPDQGRSFFLDFAAKQIAVARGLGFRGIYVGGHLSIEEYDELLARAASFASDDWHGFASELRFGFPDEFYYFEADEVSGLSSDVVNRSYADSLVQRRTELRTPLRYRASRQMHKLVFDDGAPMRQSGRRTYEFVERHPRAIGKALHVVEQAVKVPLFGCRDCGDCSLPEIAYLCPESQCVKNQRNGPCGGTREGKCEIGEKDCIWALAYERLKAYAEAEAMLEQPVVFRDNSLRGTSAWANTLLERDHRQGGS